MTAWTHLSVQIFAINKATICSLKRGEKPTGEAVAATAINQSARQRYKRDDSGRRENPNRTNQRSDLEFIVAGDVDWRLMQIDESLRETDKSDCGVFRTN